MGKVIALTQAGSKNECNGCDVCCTVMAVEELGKPYYAKCQHARYGCGIYGKHPETCANWICVWKSGLAGDESDRPDKLGFMFNIYNATEDGVTHSILEVFEAKAVLPESRWLRMNSLLNLILNKIEISAILIYTFKSQVGSAFELQDPYPKDSYHVERKFHYTKLPSGQYLGINLNVTRPDALERVTQLIGANKSINIPMSVFDQLTRRS